MSTSASLKVTDIELRSRAERLLATTRQELEAMSTNDVQELVHELQVHQVELQMQNEALHQAQGDLEESQQKYLDLYDRAPIGYLTVNRDGLITQANFLAGVLFNCDSDRLLGRKISGFLKSSSQDSWHLHSRAVLRNGERQTCQIETGHLEFSHLQATSQADKADADFFRVTLTDITMMKRLESRLASMHEAAEAASAAKSQFLANMSHEIRTPLNAIIGLGSLLKRSQLDEKQQKFIATLCMSADSLLALINELLDFSKIESNHIELEHCPFSLHNLANEVLEISWTAAKDKSLALSLEFNPELPEWYFGDAHRIRQVLVNLVSNAVKFTSQGSVVLRFGGDVVGQDRASVEMLVSDTGIGIADDKRESIFENFTQADASTTRKFGGTGLGLAISRKLVERMNGEINVTSVLGQGSVFSIVLPLQLSQPLPNVVSLNSLSRSPLARDEKHATILLVEDHPPNVLLATVCLADAGYDCDVASNGREAIRLFQEKRYAGILMDVQMPEMDGYETTTQIRAIEAARGLHPTPIIAVTAHAAREDRERCLASGMDDYISKPFDVETLKEKLDLIL